MPEPESDSVNLVWESDGVPCAFWEVGMVPRGEVITVSAGLAERLLATSLVKATNKAATWPRGGDVDKKPEKPSAKPAEKEKEK
jgi:hypothetical protein